VKGLSQRLAAGTAYLLDSTSNHRLHHETGPSDHPATFFACARTFAQRFFAAFAIFALPAADSTRFFTLVTSCFVEPPKALAAARIQLNCCCTFPTVFLVFFLRA